MSGGGGSSKSTTNTVAEPWKGVQPFMTQGYQELAGLYGTPSYDRKGNLTDWQYGGQGPQYYPGQTVVNPNALEGMGQNLQLGALGGMQGLSNLSQSGLAGLFGAQSQTQGGLGAAYQGIGGLLGAGNQAQQGFDWNRAGLENLLGYAYGNAPREGESGAITGMQNLLRAGDPTTNPYFQSTLQAAMRPVTEQFTEQVLPGIRRGAVASGGVGGSRQGIAEGIASRGYADTLGDIATNMGNQAYAQGLQALQAGAGIGQNLMSQGLGAAGQAAGLGQGVYGQALGALGSAAGLGSGLYESGLTSAGRGAALAPSIQQMGLLPGQVMEGIGQQRTADAQAQTDADIARWNYGQQLPYSMMSDYLAMLQGAPGGTTASTMSSPQTGSLLGRVGGGALAGYGLTSSPYGALAGGLLGLF